MISVKTVEHIIIGFVLFLLFFNVYLGYFNKIKNDTVNIILKNWASSKHFFITFAWGVLGGHFFLGTRIPLFGSNWWLPVLLIILVLAILFFIGKRMKSDFTLKSEYQFILLILGVLYGHFIWSQRHIPNIDFPW